MSKCEVVGHLEGVASREQESNWVGREIHGRTGRRQGGVCGGVGDSRCEARRSIAGRCGGDSVRSQIKVYLK